MKLNWNTAISVATFHTSCVSRKVVPKNLKGKGKSSQDWLTRQLNDPYVKLARYEHYRARSAFKLREIDDRHKILRHGQVVVECGAAPGAWTQVAVPRVNSLLQDKDKPQGLVIGVDLLSMHRLPGATMIGGRDFTDPKTQQQILDILQGKKINVVLSDMAPNATGMRSLDHENIVELAYAALQFAIQNSAADASFLCKIWEGHKHKQLITDMNECYSSVKVVKPPSSRSDSSEQFLLGKHFMGRGR